ncbi:hypothetical protein TanjilG_29263 [Lupinus angustifolius]|uniref:RING-type E3 ubiquitin transferase n=1 Tax=Lupinus angustifolius TaxID=3871 RepID=A0A1J7I4G2_LUPAN|nr:PREDICTED: RING-H2 finger protein ATL3-like [Lupinus angustifolius]OIW13522.1 hypothetical protein TanjilG_29263 [Lupinus angustifolius]
MDDTSEKLGESPATELTGKIMIVAIIILFLVVVFCFFLHLYAKFTLCTGSHRHRRRRHRFVFATSQEPPSHGALRKGLDPLVLRSLPIIVFQSEEFKDGLECAVCLCDVVDGEKTRLLPKCNHGFHVECIDMWFQSHSNCPICRNPLDSESCSSNDRQNASENIEPLEPENSPNFPTNVFIWGNQSQISSIGALLEDNSSNSSSSSSTIATTTCTSASCSSSRNHGMLVIDIPSESTSSSMSPSASRFAEDDLKSPISARLRSLKRLFSWDRRLNPSTPSPVDVEQGGEAQH